MNFKTRLLSLLAVGLAASLLAGCERPPIVTTQGGFRGNGMEQNINPRTEAVKVALNRAPEAAAPASPDGPKAADIYKNVQVLGHLSVAEFSRNMAAITQWVAPQEGCAYCHNVLNFADESKYTKVVARRMLQMTQTLNSDWKQHNGATGVTCYTCHRGNPVPQQVWFKPGDRKYAANSSMGNLASQNIASKAVGLSSLPNDIFTPYLLDAKPIRVNGNEALRMTGAANNNASTKQAEFTYGLMIHFSNSLGVNCTHCHNAQAVQSWAISPPTRSTAWYGIRMVRAMNNDYIVPLTDTFPANRLGVKGDVAKVNCATCHQGVNKPLYGAAMAKDHPELLAAYKGGSLPAPLAEAMRAVMYFNTSSATLEGEQAKGMAQLVASMAANPAATVTISGYHSASGEVAANQELAKQRAIAVRDSLVAGGVATERVLLEKPVQVESNLAGEDPAARRVEVTVK